VLKYKTHELDVWNSSSSNDLDGWMSNKKGFSDIRIVKRWSNRDVDIHGGN